MVDFQESNLYTNSLPNHYTLGYFHNEPKIIVLRDHQPFDYSYMFGADKPVLGWHTSVEDALERAWMDYYEQIAIRRNKMRSDECDHVLAWKLPDGSVYSVDHLNKRHTPREQLEEITINSSDEETLRDSTCEHCGAIAIDDEQRRRIIMRETIKQFLTENNLKASTKEVGIVNIDLHPSGRCFETTIEGPGGKGVVVTYHGEYIPVEDIKSPESQLWQVHDLIDGYEETFERWVDESHEHYVRLYGEEGARGYWQESKEMWEILQRVLGEDLFWKFYWLDSNAD